MTTLRRCWCWARSPEGFLWLSWAQLILSVIGWPLSALTLAKDEPQFVLGLSWFAIISTAHGNIATAQVNQKTEN